MKKIAILLLVVMIVSAQGVQFAEIDTVTVFSGGTGTSEDPYLIGTSNDLIELSQKYGPYLRNSDRYYRLISDIDLGQHLWEPIGNQREPFRGTFDGNGKTVTINGLETIKYQGLFGAVDLSGNVNNLTVQANLTLDIKSNEDVYLGMIAGYTEGTIENCVTKGTLSLVIESPGEVYIGGLIGKGSGNLVNVSNETSVDVHITGTGVGAVGGIIGSGYGSPKTLKNATNKGAISLESSQKADVGGIAGNYSFDGSISDVVNMGNITMINTSFGQHLMVNAGGIVGELWQANLSKAVNSGSVTTHYRSTDFEVVPRAGGITGSAGHATISSVGNKGSITAKGDMLVNAAGITAGSGPNLMIQNAYNKGAIYGSTIQQRNAELYVAGMMEGEATVDNFYNSGTVRIKAGSLNEIDVEALKNVRPGENTKIYNYCYWSSELLPFPLLIRPEATNSAFNRSNGVLNKDVTVGSAKYSKLSTALNAWVDSRGSDYLEWSDETLPEFKGSLGYKAVVYRNQVDGKWTNASDWAVPWLNQANQKNMIPDILINRDMTLDISRREFSGLVVALYEHIREPVFLEDGINPFVDTTEEAVLKAYSLGIVTGVGNDKFAPEAFLTREQASVMMTRVYKALEWDGWSLDQDGTYTGHKLDIEGVNPFANDVQISDWAKESVYFMVKSNMINGVGNNSFDAQGRATREQAFKIAVAMVDMLD